MRAAKFILGTAAGAFLLAGCLTHEPPTTAELRQQGGAPVAALLPETPWKKPGLGEAGAIQDNWLASFGDPQLDLLVAEALANNPDLRVASARVEQAAQYVEMSKAALRPSISLLGTGGANMGGGDVESALQGLSLGVSWEPDLWARLRYGRNAAEASYASVMADFEFSRQSLAAMVAKSWFAATETWLQLELAENMVKSGFELSALADKRREIGPGNEQEAALARANLGKLEDSLSQVRFAHEQALRALELLLGRYPAAELQARRDLPELPGPIPVGMPLQMLERRPDLIAAERRVAMAFNRVGEAKAARLPRIVLNANVAAISSEILELQSDFENPTAGVGARLIAPIYKGGELRAQVNIRTAEQKEAVAQYARHMLRALGDVENAFARERALSERDRLLLRTALENERALNLMETSYRVGRTDRRTVEQQYLNLYSARLALLRVESEQLSQRIDLHLALGGSFEIPPEPPPEPEPTGDKVAAK